MSETSSKDPLTEPSEYGDSSEKSFTHRSKINLELYTYLALAAGAICVLLFATSGSGGENIFARIGASFALALGAVVVGALLGFVFGIPRTLQHNAPPPIDSPKIERERIGYQINTNLEQISDWLTKIIIGVGLIELGRIGRWLMQFSEHIGNGFSNGVFGQAFVLGTVLYFVSAGFLFGYLWTRLRFGIAIKTADKGLIEIEQIEKGLLEDSRAMQLVSRQLNSSGAESAGITQDQLNAAITRATKITRTKVFYLASKARTDDERREASIPVFQALIASDGGGTRYHRNHGDLGFALKDKAPPDWAAAEAALSKAIEIRDRINEPGWGAYEANRAICQIQLGRPKNAILEDLKKALSDWWVRSWIFDDPIVSKWCTENKINLRELLTI